MRRTLVALAIAASSWNAVQPGLFDPLSRLLSSLWDEAATKSGCGIDPWGGCKAAPAQAPQPQTEEGCGLDPWGGPHGS